MSTPQDMIKLFGRDVVRKLQKRKDITALQSNPAFMQLLEKSQDKFNEQAHQNILTGNVKEFKINLEMIRNFQANAPAAGEKILNTCLMDAVRNKKTEICKCILAEKFTIDEETARGIINIVVSNGYVEILDCLLQHGVDPNRYTCSKQGTMLMLAIISKGLAIDKITKTLNESELQQTKMKKKIEEIQQNFNGIIRKLLQKKADVNAIEPKTRLTALHHAVDFEDIDSIKGLIAFGANVDVEANDEIATPLLMAIIRKNYPIIKLILNAIFKAKLPLRKIQRSSEFAASLLRSVIHHNDDKMLHTLLEAPYALDPNAIITDGVNPLLHALAMNSHACLKLLLEKGVDVNISCEGYSPLKFAIDRRDIESAKLLLEKGAQQNKDKDGYPVLWHAIIRSQPEMIKLLIHYKADINERASNGATALHVASQLGHLHCVKELLANGANAELMTVTQETPLIQAASHGHVEVVKTLISTVKKINLDAVDLESDATALMLAARLGYEEVVKVLAESGAEIETTCTDEALTPLMISAKHGHSSIVKFLVNKGADLEKRSATNLTAFEFACKFEQTDCIQLLIDLGVDKKQFNVKIMRLPLALEVIKILKSNAFPEWRYLAELSFIYKLEENDSVAIEQFLQLINMNEIYGRDFLPKNLPYQQGFFLSKHCTKQVKCLILKNKYHHGYPEIEKTFINQFSQLLQTAIDNFDFAADASLCISLTIENKKYEISISEEKVIELINKSDVQKLLMLDDKRSQLDQFKKLIWGFSNEAKELKEEQEINSLKESVLDFLYQGILEIETHLQKIMDLSKIIKNEGLNIDSKAYIELQSFCENMGQRLKKAFAQLKNNEFWKKSTLNIKEILVEELKLQQELFKPYQDKNIDGQLKSLKDKIIAEQNKNATLNPGKAAKKKTKRDRKRREKQEQNELALQAKADIKATHQPNEAEPVLAPALRKEEGVQEPQFSHQASTIVNTEADIKLRHDSTLIELQTAKNQFKTQKSQVPCKAQPCQFDLGAIVHPTGENKEQEEKQILHLLSKQFKKSRQTQRTLDSVVNLSAHLKAQEAATQLKADLKATIEAKTSIETLINCEALEARLAKVLENRKELNEDWPAHVRLVLFKNERPIYDKYSKEQLIKILSEIIKKLGDATQELIRTQQKLSLLAIDTEGFLIHLCQLTESKKLENALSMLDLANNNLEEIENYIITNAHSDNNIHLREAIGRNFARVGTYLDQIKGLDADVFRILNKQCGIFIPIAAGFRHDEKGWELAAETFITRARSKRTPSPAMLAAFGLTLGSSELPKTHAEAGDTKSSLPIPKGEGYISGEADKKRNRRSKR